MSSPKDKNRVEELETQVKELTGLVDILIDSQEDSEKAHTPRRTENPDQLELKTSLGSLAIVDGVKESLNRMLGVQQGESVETRIGSTWLPRIAVLLFMTVLVIGMREDSLQSLYKIWIGYGIGAVLSVYGIWRRPLPGLFPKAMMGIGLSTLYYSTYALYYLPETQLVQSMDWALPTMAGTLLLIGILLWLSKSQFASMIVFLFIGYTITQYFSYETDSKEISYPIISWGIMAFITALLQFRGGWKYTAWITLFSVYGGFIYYLSYPLAFSASTINGEPIDEVTYDIISNIFLSSVYILLAFSTMACARTHTTSGRSMILFSTLNTLAYLYTNQHAIAHTPEYAQWGFALLSIACVIFTIAARPKFALNNVIMQALLCQAVLWATLYLCFALTLEWRLISFAAICLLLAIVYKRLPLTVIIALQFMMMVGVFIGAFYILNLSGEIQIQQFLLPTKWVFSLGLVSLFTITAWYYDNRIAPYPTTLVHTEGSWILSGPRWKWSPSVIAILNTTLSAFILSVLTIYDLGSDPRLPFILALEGLVFAFIGLMFRTPQMELSSVLLLVSAHVTFHFFLYMDIYGFTDLPYFIEASICLVLISYLASYFWERYVSKIEEGTDWEHDLLSAIPFVASTLILTSLAETIIDSPIASLAQVSLGLLLMATGMFNRLIGLRIAALTALGLGSISFYLRSLNIQAPNTDYEHYLLIVMGIVLCLAASERILFFWERRIENSSRITPGFHSILVLGSIAIGTLGIWHGASEEKLSLYLMAWSLSVLTFGAVFRSSYYRIAALILIFSVLVRLYIYDLASLDPLLKILVFAIFTGIIFLISWGYTRKRAK